jgi:hypothetical protein
MHIGDIFCDLAKRFWLCKTSIWLINVYVLMVFK